LQKLGIEADAYTPITHLLLAYFAFISEESLVEIFLSQSWLKNRFLKPNPVYFLGFIGFSQFFLFRCAVLDAIHIK